MTNEEWENYYCDVIAPKDFADKIYRQCDKEDLEKERESEVKT